MSGPDSLPGIPTAGPGGSQAVSVGGGTVIQQVGLNASQKAEFMQEIRAELTPLITRIAHDQGEKSVRPIRINLEDYMQRADTHRNMMVESFQKEMQTISDYFKKVTSKIQTDNEAAVRELQKNRARDRADYDNILAKLTD